MAEITIRPDFKTSGGECSDIMWKGRFVGSMTLLYREQERITGSIQLEKESLPAADKDAVVDLIREHVQSLIHAIRATECDVLLTYSSYDHVIATPAVDEDETDTEWVADDEGVVDHDPNEVDAFEMAGPGTDYSGKSVVYELVVVDESRSQIDYHIYDNKQNWIAEAAMRWHGANVTGEIDWVFAPSEEEIEHVTDLVVSDFDENIVDSFELEHRFEGEVVETIELTHEDLLEEYQPSYKEAAESDEDYTVVLARDDGDMLTYEIYKQTHGGLPIGTATVDISRRQLSGFIDFRDIEATEDTEVIAELLMRELDKEKEYDTFSLTMLHKNEPIDEIIFESEQLH